MCTELVPTSMAARDRDPDIDFPELKLDARTA